MTDESLIGSIWRDTYDDKRERNLRTIEITAHGVRLEAKVLTATDGSAYDPPRTTRLSMKTLRSGYERVEG